MTARRASLLPHLRRLAVAGPDADADPVLLERFLRDHDESAFAALVARHGAMVMRVCSRVLGDDHAAEDAFQAAFLVLAQRAGAIRTRDSLAAWLHGVAHRVSLKARAADARRRDRESPPTNRTVTNRDGDPLAALTARELLTVVDEEVRRLPEVYRVPVILCCLEGRTQEEAARQIGWTPGSLQGRLERGRALLRARLARRGVSLSAALLGTALGEKSSAAAAGLAPLTVRAALAWVTAGTGLSVRAPGRAAWLAGCVPGSLPRTAFKLFPVLALAVGVAVAGVGLRARPVPGRQPDEVAQPAAPPAVGGGERGGRRTDPLPAGAVARLGSVRFWAGSPVDSVAFAPSGKILASGHGDHTVRLWDADTGIERAVLREHRDAVMAVAFSPDGKRLASRGGGVNCQDNRICLRELPSGKLLRHFGGSKTGFLPSFTGSPAWAFRVAFSPDGKVLAAGPGDPAARDNRIRLWDPDTGVELRSCRGHEKPVRGFAFAPDGKTLASGSEDRTVRLWDPATGKELHQLRGHRGPVTSVAYSPDGKILASAGGDGAIRFWDVAGGKELRRVETAGPVPSVCFVSDRILARGDEQGRIHLVDAGTGKGVRQLARHRFGVSDLCRSPDGKVLASAGSGADFAVPLWDVDSGKKLSPPAAGHECQVASVAYSPDGKTLASTGWDVTVRFWDPASGKEVRRVEGGGTGVAYSPDGTLLAVLADFGGEVRVTGAASGKGVCAMKHPGSGNFQCLAFAPDGKALMTGENRLFDKGFEGVLCLWDVATGKELRLFRGHRDRVERVAFSPDGATVASVSERGSTVRLWEVATGKELRQLPGLPDFATAVAFSGNGEVVAAAGGTTLLLWEAATGKELRRLGGTQWITSLALSPDGRMLACGGEDNGPVVRLWEVETGQAVRRWEGHRGQIPHVAFAPDCRTLASASHDARVLVWDVTGRLENGRLPPARPTRGEREALWADLAGADAVRAHRAVWELAAADGPVMRFLGAQTSAVPAADPRRVARLVADLDADRFATREAATAELERLGEPAVPPLRAVLQGSPSLEVRRRAGQLLRKLTAPSPARLRELRVVGVLEYNGTAEAVRVLEALAGGAPEARLTREAKAALARTHKRHGLTSGTPTGPPG